MATATNDPTAQRPAAAANAQQEVDQRRANRSVVMFGFSAALGMFAVGYLHADLLTAIGVAGTVSALGVLVPGLAVSGGTKTFHDLIGNIQKSRNAKEDPAATGGTAGA